ncbi:MAG: Fur family transcriptional regulator [Actinomycetota bacterium]
MTTGSWQTQLRASGYRLTPQRQLVLEAVSELGHATPDEILTAVRTTAHGVNISTVYRTLELLETLGLVRHTHLGHGAPTYHAAVEDAHVHLVCRTCGDISEVVPEVVGNLVERLAAQEGFAADVGHLAIFGLCRECTAGVDAAELPT